MTGRARRIYSDGAGCGRKALPGKWVALMAAALGAILLLPPFDSVLVHLSYDSLFWLRDDRPANEALVVYMDPASHERLGQPRNQAWDRALHARLIKRLSELGARAIVFDVLFAEAGDVARDRLFIAAAHDYGRVAVAAVVNPVYVDGGLVGWETQQAFPGLAAVSSSGVAAQADPDRAIRRHFFNPSATNLPSLGARAVQLAGLSLPPDLTELWLNYYGPPGYLPHTSYHEVLDANAASQRQMLSLVSNRVIFVGAAQDSVGFTGGRNTDDFRTPYWSGQASPGVEINATSFLNLARREWLRRLPAPVEFGMIIMTGLISGLAFASLRPGTAVGGALLAGTAIAAASMFTAWHGAIWVPWAIPAFAQIPLAVGAAMMGHVRQIWREKRAFEQALALASEGKGTTTEPAPRRTDAALPPAPSSARPDFLRDLPASEQRDGLPSIPDHELLRCIGSGGYGEVWLARDILGTHHAVKLVRLGSASHAGPVQTEFEGLRRFTPISRSHPGLVHVLHVGYDPAGTCLYYVMELADAEAGDSVDPGTYTPRTLAQELVRRSRIPLDEVLIMGTKLADALEHLHRHQLVHRDIKPANIVFVQGQPKLADVGLVSDVVSGVNGLAFLGTPGRIAPEGAGRPSADVFSLGKVLYEAGFGLPVDRFPELPADMISAGADPGLFDLNRILMKACDPDPHRRHGSAGELRDALHTLWKRRNPGELPSAWNQAATRP